MPGTRKLGRETSNRKALLNNLVTSLIINGKIETTEAKAKEVKPIIDKLVALAIKEKDNFEMAEKTVSKVKVDKKGNKVTEKATSKNGNEYTKVVREIVKEEAKKDMPSKLAARRKIMTIVKKAKDSKGNTIDAVEKLFEEIAPKYEKVVGGYTRIIKLVPRKGDGANMAILQLI